MTKKIHSRPGINAIKEYFSLKKTIIIIQDYYSPEFLDGVLLLFILNFCNIMI